MVYEFQIQTRIHEGLKAILANCTQVEIEVEPVSETMTAIGRFDQWVTLTQKTTLPDGRVVEDAIVLKKDEARQLAFNIQEMLK